MDVETPRGTARVEVEEPAGTPRARALLMHGAGGGMTSPVLLAVRTALLGAGVVVARLDQPYRVAGRRAPDPAHHLDAVALAVLAALPWSGPLVLAGKSSGARVACRIAPLAGAVGVVALGFPLHPPGRPEKSRASELAAAGVPVLVLQGSRDSFGSPAEVRAAVPEADVREIAGGDHAFRTHLDEAGTLAAQWVQALT